MQEIIWIIKNILSKLYKRSEKWYAYKKTQYLDTRHWSVSNPGTLTHTLTSFVIYIFLKNMFHQRCNPWYISMCKELFHLRPICNISVRKFGFLQYHFFMRVELFQTILFKFNPKFDPNPTKKIFVNAKLDSNLIHFDPYSTQTGIQN